MALLSVHDLSAHFGAFTAFEHITFDLEQGSLTGLIGSNGAGKSTLFSAITGYLTPTSGQVLFAGTEVGRYAIEQRVRLGLTRTFQVPREFSGLTVFQNLMAAAPNQDGENLRSLVFAQGKVRQQEQDNAERARGILDFLKLDKLASERASSLSGGQKKLLELGRVLMLEPRCIMLDEPFAGVNPVLIQELSNRIKDLHARGIALFVIEHDLTSLSRLVPKLYAMDRGRMIAEGAPEHVLKDPKVREAYMGGVI
jgi:branched-chain amino acid transport system ATP-binding protein